MTYSESKRSTANKSINKKQEKYIMNKVMILAILVAYKAFNDKSLTIVVNEDNHEYVVNNAIIDGIDCDTISIFSNTNGDIYCKTIDIDDITGIQFQK